jgi:hypothetical protein
MNAPTPLLPTRSSSGGQSIYFEIYIMGKFANAYPPPPPIVRSQLAPKFSTRPWNGEKMRFINVMYLESLQMVA